MLHKDVVCEVLGSEPATVDVCMLSTKAVCQLLQPLCGEHILSTDVHGTCRQDQDTYVHTIERAWYKPKIIHACKSL